MSTLTCAHHPQTRSLYACRACDRGYCHECVGHVRGAAICRQCQGLCVDAAKHAKEEAEEQRKRVPMRDEAHAILTFPLTDKLAFAIMVLVVWFFGLGRDYGMGRGFAVLLSTGLLMAYSFNALVRASNGHFRDFLPEIGSLGDLAEPLWASFAALLSSCWPLIVAAVLGWTSPVGPLEAGARPEDSPAIVSVAHAQDDDAPEPVYVDDTAGDTADDPAGDPVYDGEPEVLDDLPDAPPERPAPSRPAPLQPGFWFLLVGVVWYVVYAPVALIVAAISRSAGLFSCLVQTLNPLVGLSTILRMGSTYWAALGFYFAIAIPQLLLGVALSHIPFAGGVVRAFVDGYASLAIGFALGLAVFKKSAAQ
jgi:hypothetical protein